MTFYGFRINLDAHVFAPAAFLFLLLFAAIMTVIMLWHWKRYGFNMKGIVVGEIVYLTGLVVLLAGAFFELSFLT